MLPVWFEFHGLGKGQAGEEGLCCSPTCFLCPWFTPRLHVSWSGPSRGRWGKKEVFSFLGLYFSPLVTGEIYQFNSKTGARKWKDPLKQMPKRTEPSPQGAAAAPGRVAAAEGGEPLRSSGKEGDGPGGKAPAKDSGLTSRSRAPQEQNPALTSRTFFKSQAGK